MTTDIKETPDVKSPAPFVGNVGNDDGHARKFIDQFEMEVRYVVEAASWLLWEDCRWVRDNCQGSKIRRKFLEHVRCRMNAAFQIENDAGRKAEVKEAISLGNTGKIESVLALAKHDLRIQISETELDSHPMLLGVENGIVDLRSGTLLPPDPSRYVTRSMRAKYAPESECPAFTRFLDDIFQSDTSVMDFMWKVAGYSLTGMTKEQVFLFLHGVGSNGKSTFTGVLSEVFGDYAGVAGKNIIARSRHGSYPESEIAELSGARFVLASETAEGERLNENVIKDITGGDRLRGRRLYEAGFSFVPQCKLWVYGNYKPDVRGTDDGIWRRVRLVPFDRQFSGKEKDPGMPDKLRLERDGILTWMIRGCLAWQKEGLPTPHAVSEAVKSYREDSDTLREFIDDKIAKAPGSTVTRAELYEAYRQWAESEGLRPFGGRTFAARMRDRCVATEKKSHGTRVWEDIKLV